MFIPSFKAVDCGLPNRCNKVLLVEQDVHIFRVHNRED